MKKPLIAITLCLGLVSCAFVADLLGVATQEELDTKVAAVKATGSWFGQYGELASTGIAALLVLANNAHRNGTRKKAIAKVTTTP